MVKETAFYDTFGVSPDAPLDQIKKAYRKLALKCHPDKNPSPEAAEQFKNISYQFSVLEDTKKRNVYDSYGEAGLREGGMDAGHFSTEDFISQMFPGFGGFFGGGSRREARGKDIVHELYVTLEQLYNGATRKLQLRRDVVCADCNGQGGQNVAKCQKCHGRGVVLVVRQLGPGMITQMQTACDACQGQGEKIAEKDRCKKCGGHKLVEEKQVFEVHIDKGMKDGHHVKFSGQGDQTPGLPPGDMVVILRQKEHDIFQRQGDSLLMDMEITLVEALCGFQRPITHLDNRTLLVTVPPGDVIQEGSVKMVAEEGMPHVRHHEVKGNLLIKFKVVFPESLELDKVALVEQALGPKPAPPMAMEDMEEVNLTDAKGSQGGYGHMNGDSDDEDGQHGGGQRVQCESQ